MAGIGGRGWGGRLLVVLLCAVLSACTSGSTSRGRTSSAAQASGTRSSSGPTSGSPSASAAPTGPDAQVAAALAGLNRRAQVAQLFLAGVPLSDLSVGDGLARSGVGGLFLAGRSQLSTATLAAETARWQSLAPGPALWIAADQEGGKVQTLSGPGFARIPAAVDQGRLPHDQLAALARNMGASLHRAGLNLDLAPVADVVPAGTERDNPPIGFYGRQYGSTAASVSAAAGTVLEGLAASGVTATVKHFPGLGRVRANTDSAVVTDTLTAADDEQVALFGALARSPAHPFVMMSSATYARIDPRLRAVFSPDVLTGLLRSRLGFDGVVVTDDMGKATAVAAVPPGDRAVAFLAAGGTMILTAIPSIVPTMIDAVLSRSAADPAFSARVDAAVRIALLAKARAGLLPPL